MVPQKLLLVLFFFTLGCLYFVILFVFMIAISNKLKEKDEEEEECTF